MINKEEVKHIAKLARLGLTEKELGRFQKELSAILNYIEKLKEVDISKVEPTSHSITRAIAKGEDERSSSTTRAIAKGGDTAAASSTEMENVMRNDEIKSKIKNQKSKRLLDLAPETKEGYLKTKSIL